MLGQIFFRKEKNVYYIINFAFNLKTLIAIPCGQICFETKKVSFNLKTLVSTTFGPFLFLLILFNVKTLNCEIIAMPFNT